MNIKLSNSLKIKLNDSGKGSGANFDYDFQIVVIDKTKKPYKKKLLSRKDMMRINAPLNGRCAIKTIDDFIEWTFCYNSPLYIQFRNDPTKNWNIEKQQWETVKPNQPSATPSQSIGTITNTADVYFVVMSAVNKQSIYFWAITPINVMGNADFSVMQRSGMLVNSLKIYIKNYDK